MSRTFRKRPPGDWTDPEKFDRGHIRFPVKDRKNSRGVYSGEDVFNPKAKKKFKKHRTKQSRQRSLI